MKNFQDPNPAHGFVTAPMGICFVFVDLFYTTIQKVHLCVQISIFHYQANEVNQMLSKYFYTVFGCCFFLAEILNAQTRPIPRHVDLARKPEQENLNGLISGSGGTIPEAF
jgi:hypothetical protein